MTLTMSTGATSSSFNMSLDDIISKNRKPRGGGGGGGGGFGGGRRGAFGGGGNRRGFGDSGPIRRGNMNARWSHDLFSGVGGGGGGASSVGPTKLRISNLEFGVTDSDVLELFSEFGRISSAAVHYDRSGRSMGTAQVIFERRSDAVNAVKQYNGVHLDGRPMLIAYDDVPTGPVQRGGMNNSFGARYNNPVKRLGGGGGGRGGGFGGSGFGGGGGGFGGGGRGFSGRGGRGARRGGGGGGGGRGGQDDDEKPLRTAEELDAELEDYINKAPK